MVSKEVENEIERIELELKEKSNLLLNNSVHFSKKYRGNEDLDVNLFFLLNENNGREEINLFVGNKDSRVLNIYIIKDKELVKIEKRYANGHKRIHNTYR